MISICYDGEKKSDLETSTRAVLDYVREEKKVLRGKKSSGKLFGNQSFWVPGEVRLQR